MRIDGIQLSEGSTVSNLSVATGTAFPASPNSGELFYRIDSDPTVLGLYVYISNGWDRIASTESVTIPVGASFPVSALPGDLYYKSGDSLYVYSGSVWELASGAPQEVGDLDASKITTGTFANARISQSSVTQHQASLSITESQIPDGAVLARVSGNENIGGSWQFITAPTVPTQSVNTANTTAASTAFVINQGGTTAPVMDGTAAAGTSFRFSHEDHVHPTDTSRAPINNPTFTGTVAGVTKGMVGLGNVDNTADADKPISSAQQTAIDLKANIASPTLTGIPAAPTAAADTTTTQIATTAFVVGQAGTATPAMDAVATVGTSKKFARDDHIHPTDTTRAPINSPTFTGTVGGITKAMVGLGNVDNTSDANKPISTAEQTALDLKANIASPIFTGVPQVPTATPGTSSGQVASTAFVQAAGMPVGGGTNRAFFENDTTITTSYTITTGKNAMSAGPITVSNGAVVTVPNGSTWTVL